MFPYVKLSLFKLRIKPDATAFGLSDDPGSASGGSGDASEWDMVLTDILETESERVEGPEYADGKWRGEDATPPAVVKDAVIALAQHSVDQMAQRGLEKESLGSGASGSGGSYTYRPPEELRDEVKQSLSDAGFEGEFWSVTRGGVGGC